MSSRMSSLGTCRPRSAMEESHLVGLALLGGTVIVPHGTVLARAICTPSIAIPCCLDNEHTDFVLIGK